MSDTKMKLKDITKNLSDMTDSELREHVAHIRHNKYVAKPAKAKHISDAEKPEKKKRGSAVSKLLDGMSEDERAQLLLLLEGDGT
jgi:hypothetical protein